MNTEKHRMGKHEKRIKQKLAPQSDHSVEEAAIILRDEILENVRQLSDGRIVSIYSLLERGKELLILEAKLGKKSEDEDEAKDF